MAGRWIMYDNGAWDFKIDNDRMGRTVDCSKIKGVDGLKESIYAEYCLLGREISAEMSYCLNDGESDMVCVGAAPVQITTDTDYKIFKALHRADKSVNVFVTFREFVRGGMIFLRSERVIMSQINACDGAPDNDEALLQHVEAIEASFGDVGLIPLQCFRVNISFSEQEKENICGENLAVDNGKNKEANVERGCGVNPVSDDLPQENSSPPKRRGGGHSGTNRNRRSGPTSGRGQVSGKPASGRGQRSSATGGYKSTKKACIWKRSEVNTDEVRDYICTSRTAGFAYTEETYTEEGVDVVLLTPPKPNNQHNRVIEDDDDFVESVRSGETIESIDVVLVTPPKKYNKHNRVIEDDDEAVDPPITECTEGHDGVGVDDDFVYPAKCTPPKENRLIEDSEYFIDPPVTQHTQVQGGESFMRGIQFSEMYGYNDVDPVFDDMRGSSFKPVEDDDEAVDPPISECTDVHNGVGADDEFVDPRRCTPPKQNRVIEDSEEFVDPSVTQSTQTLRDQ
ncbi:hypothetical protein YC2023_058364 [Brassica napus]